MHQSLLALLRPFFLACGKGGKALFCAHGEVGYQNLCIGGRGVLLFLVNTILNNDVIVFFFFFRVGRPARYASLNHHMPVLRLWFDVEAELKQDFRLTRR